ncbi:hypothetical protein ACET3Z_001209 [Daucus carota]
MRITLDLSPIFDSSIHPWFPVLHSPHLVLARFVEGYDIAYCSYFFPLITIFLSSRMPMLFRSSGLISSIISSCLMNDIRKHSLHLMYRTTTKGC